ncbi:MAG: LysM peptidoglycan-binding domain-containing protein, partial [bacterium]
MERYFTVCLSIIMFVGMGTVGEAADTDLPSNKSMVEQRLRADIQELREENKKLRRTIRRLRNNRNSSTSSGRETSEASVDQQRLKQYRKVLRKIHRLISSMPGIDVKKTSNKSSKSTQKKVRNPDDSSGGEWVQEEGRPYPIRKEPLQEETTYVTDGDDTLSKISHQFYHDADLWLRVYLVNESRLPSPDTLPPGTRLRLPPL